MNFLFYILYFIDRKIVPGFKIKKNALVIDIGSGDKPFWRGDVFVDDLSLGDVQRASHTKTIHNIGTFVDANVANLPFRDKAFDFSFCSHLLEHVIDPDVAINEIMRISKSGYIEVPNGIIEHAKPFVSHIWFIYQNKNKLVFVRKSRKIHETLLANAEKFTAVGKEPFIRIYWKNKIEYEIISECKKKEEYFSPKIIEKKTITSTNYYFLLVLFLRSFFYKKKNVPINIYK